MSLREERESKISLLLWVCQVAILWMSISVLIWLCLQPTGPGFILSYVYIPPMNQQNSTFLNNTEAAGNSAVRLNFIITNPNERIGIHYNDINITLCYNDAVISTSFLSGFYQGYKKATSYGTSVNVTGVRRGSTSTSSEEMIRVCLETAVRYQIFKWKTKHHLMDLEAYVGIGSDGRILGQREIKLLSATKHKIKCEN